MIALLAFFQSVRSFKPLAWQLAVIVIGIGAPMAYAISNYGTLFRLREMIFIGLLLIPLTVLDDDVRAPDDHVIAPDDGETLDSQ